MQVLCIVLVALLAAVNVNAIYDKQLKALVQSILDNMDKPQYGLPPLDPFQLSHLAVNIDQPIATLKGELDNVTMTKLSTLQLDTMSLTLGPIGVKFNVSLAELDLSGYYDIDGSLGGDLLPVYGKGPFAVEAGDVWVYGAVNIASYSSNNTLYIKAFDLDYHLGFVHTNISGLLGGGDLSDVVNQMLSDLIPSAAEKYKTKISAAISDVVIGIGNKALYGLTLKDIVNIITGKTTTAAPSTAAPVSTTPLPTTVQPGSTTGAL